MVRNEQLLFSLKHLILQKLIAKCEKKVFILLMELELQKILAISKLGAFFFFLNHDQILFSDMVLWLLFKCF